MFNTLPHTTHRRWAIFYATAAALLAGWLLLEKLPDGRDELAGSVGGMFRGSLEVIRKSNGELLTDIQDEVEDYPYPRAEDYAKRAEKALALAVDFEHSAGKDGTVERLSLLKDSLMLLADREDDCQKWADDIVGVGWTSELLADHKSLKTSLLPAQSQALAAVVLNYFATKVSGTDGWGFSQWTPAFLPNTSAPMLGEPFQAEIALTTYSNPRCADFTCFLNDQPLPLREGIAAIRTTFPTPGPHTLRLRFRREMCRDGSVTEVSRDFQVNVLAKCAEE